MQRDAPLVGQTKEYDALNSLDRSTSLLGRDSGSVSDEGDLLISGNRHPDDHIGLSG